MKKNQKKIVGTLLGLMASISGTNAMQNGSAKDNNIKNSAGNTKNQNDESKVLKKRVQAGVNPYLKVAGFVLEAMLLNDLASTIPGAGKYFRPLIRPLVSNYRVVHGFRGYINRHDNPLYKNIFKLAGDDGHDFRVRVDKGDNLFKWQDPDLKDIQDFKSELYTRKIAKIEDNIDAIPARNKNEDKKKMKLSEYLSEPSVNLVAEAKVKGQNVYYRLFDEYASIWSVDDAAKAVGKANKLLDIINNEKMSKDEKKNAILKKFGENAVFVPSNLKGESTIFRIFLKKSEMNLNNVDDLAKEIAEKKFLAGKFGDIKLGLENEDNKQVINDEKGKIRNRLSQLEQSNGVVDVNCYVEFKIVM